VHLVGNWYASPREPEDDDIALPQILQCPAQQGPSQLAPRFAAISEWQVDLLATAVSASRAARHLTAGSFWPGSGITDERDRSPDETGVSPWQEKGAGRWERRSGDDAAAPPPGAGLGVVAVFLPRSLEEALDAFARVPEAQLFAGGTDFMVQVNAGARRPAAVVSLRGVPELKGWRRDGSEVVLGAGLTYTEMLAAHFGDLVPLLAQAARTIGSPPDPQCRDDRGQSRHVFARR